MAIGTTVDPPPTGERYASKIIKVGALLADTKLLLTHWDPDASVGANLDRVGRENMLGKSSRSRARNILAVLRQRYLYDEAVVRSLVTLVRRRLPSSSLDRILYFHSAKADRLLYDTVDVVLGPAYARGDRDVDVAAVERAVGGWVADGRTNGTWGEGTIRRVTQGLLSTLRDFGVLQGAVNKRIAPAHLPVEAFAYIVFHLRQRQPSGARLIEHADWRLFFLPPDAVERLILEAHQQGLLDYHAAGSVTRLTFPAGTLDEYADAIASRTNKSS